MLHYSHDHAFPDVTNTSGRLVRVDLLVLKRSTCVSSSPHLSHFLGAGIRLQVIFFMKNVHCSVLDV